MQICKSSWCNALWETILDAINHIDLECEFHVERVKVACWKLFTIKTQFSETSEAFFGWFIFQLNQNIKLPKNLLKP